MKALSTTLEQYKATYQNRLSCYKEDYEDNTESQFLKDDLQRYTAYYNILKQIAHFRKVSPKNNLGDFPITSEVGWRLKVINERLYEEIFSIIEDSEEEEEFKSLLSPGKRAPSIRINYKRLRNSITSANLIMAFIQKRAANLTNSDIQPNHEQIERFNLETDHFPIKKKKISEKWYALAYLLELKAKGLTPPVNNEGDFIKTELETIGKSITGLKGQGFYKTVKNHYKDLDKPTILKNSFGKDWKAKIIELFNDNDLLKEYITKHY